VSTISRWLVLLLAMLPACAGKHVPALQSAIGPFATFEGRLLAITPAQRWQASLSWRAPQVERGALRLVHAASGFVLEAKWDKPRLWLRDSHHAAWRSVSPSELKRHGLLLPPWTMAALLQGELPAGFRRRDGNIWQGHLDGALVRIVWQAAQRRLELTDITHGRRLVLLIDS